MNTYKCYVCEKSFERYASIVRNPDIVCCSKKCRDISYIGRFQGKSNPNYKYGGKDSKCSCGNPKDSRANQCSACAKRGFAKEGARTIFELDENCLRDIVINSLSVFNVAKVSGISRTKVRKLINKYNIDISHFVISGKAKRYLVPEIALVEDSKFRNAAIKSLIERNNLLEYRCNRCKIDSWLGEKLVIQLHHKNGNRHDNRIENLELLCPNCHSLTDTFKGKNERRYEND